MKNILKIKINNNLIKQIVTIILFIVILIGSAILEENISVGIASIVVIILCMYNIFKTKIPIIINNIDVIMLILCLSPLIPLVFGTYLSFTYTIKYIIRYLCIFGLYICTRNFCIENNKNTNIITNLFLGFISFLIVIGLDRLTFNFLEPVLAKIGTRIRFEDGLLVSTTGYKNAFAALISFGIILLIGKFIKTENKYCKALNAAVTLIFIIAILLTESRTIILILGLIGTIFLILLKSKKYTIDIMIMIFTNIVLALLGSYILKKYMDLDLHLYFWIALVVLDLIAFLIHILINKYNEKIYKIKIKKIIIITSIVFILIVIFLIISLKTTKTGLQLFKGNTTNYYKTIKNIPDEENYNIEIKIDSKVKDTNSFIKNETYKITISERDKYEQSLEDHEFIFNEFSGIKNVKFKKNPKTVMLRLKIECTNTHRNDELNIEYIKLNDKEITLAYKFLPISIIERFTDLSLSNKSVWERGVFFKDAFELIKQNPILGYGGEAWRYLYKSVQDYYYVTSETHSYITQIWLDFGLVSVMSYIILNLVIIYNLIKRKQNILLVILICSLLVIVMHSIMDFDMSIISIIFIVYMTIGIINASLVQNKKMNSVNYILYISLIIMMILISILSFKQDIYSPLIKNKLNSEKINTIGATKSLENEKIQILEEIMIKEKKYDPVYIYRDYLKLVIKNYNILNTKEENYKKIEKAVNTLANYKNESTYYGYSYSTWYTSLNLISNKLIELGEIMNDNRFKEFANKLDNVLISNYEQAIENIESYECKASTSEKEKIIENINNVYEEALQRK